MATMARIFGIVLYLITALHGYSQRDHLELRDALLSNAEQYIGWKEATGNNDGKICHFHESTGYKCGLAWCAMFGKTNYQEAGLDTKMDARAASIKNDARATHTFRGGSYWYPTKYGTGHTGFVHTWKKNSDKFVGLDGNCSDEVRYITRIKSKHAMYVSDVYPEPTGAVKKKQPKPKVIPPAVLIPEKQALQIDSGLVQFDKWPPRFQKLKLIAVLCAISLFFKLLEMRFQKNIHVY